MAEKEIWTQIGPGAWERKDTPRETNITDETADAFVLSKPPQFSFKLIRRPKLASYIRKVLK